MLRRSAEPLRLEHGDAGLPYAGGWPLNGSDNDAFAAVFRALRRNMRLIAATTVIGTAAALGIALTIASQYKASVTIFVDPQRPQIFKDRDVVSNAAPGTDNGIVESEAAIMESPALLRRLAVKLDLQHDSEFSDPSLIGEIKSVILAPIRYLTGSQGSDDPLPGIVRALSKKIDAKRRNLTYVIELTAWSQDAAKSARLANTAAELYLAQQVAARSDTANRATQWLNEQVAKLRNRVTASEKAYEQYKAASGLFDPGGQNLSDRQIAQLNEELINARAKAAEAQAKFEQLRQISKDKLQTLAASPDVLQSKVVTDLRSQYAEAARRQAELTTRYGSRHPQVQILQAQLNDISRQITGEINRIIASARIEYEVAKSREKSLTESLDELKTRAAAFNEKSVQLRELEREAQANRDLFQAYLGRAKETAARIDLQLPDSRIVSPAAVPSAPGYPPRTLIVGLGLFGSLGLGIGLAFAREALARGFRRVEEIETQFGLPPLASIPLVEPPHHRWLERAEPALGDLRWLQAPAKAGRREAEIKAGASSKARLAHLVLDKPESAFAESIRSLHHAIRHAATENTMTTILVTSALPGEGKSTVAANLARAAAGTERVLLVDGDLRRPSIAAALDIGSAPGIADLIASHGDLQECLRRDPRTGLYVLAGSKRISGADALSLLSSRDMSALLQAAGAVFDLVIIDAPPLLPIADSRVLIDQVDGVVMVVASGDTSRAAVANALRETPGLDEKLVGVVLNRAVDDFDRYYRDDVSAEKAA